MDEEAVAVGLLSDQIPSPSNSHQDSPSTFTAADVSEEKKPDEIKSPERKTGFEDIKSEIEESLKDLDPNTDKYDKYHADFTRYLQAKYFSGKNLYGGNIFEKETIIDGDIINSSRWAPTRSFTDPVQSFEDQCMSSTSAMETPPNTVNKKNQAKKSST